jgi:restriction system protein
MPTALTILAWGGAIAVVVLAVVLDALIRARRLRRQRALCDLAALSWQQFEQVIADAFRRHGYRVQEVGRQGRADGGVDLVLTRDGRTTVVQAKHWRRDVIGVQLVRELFGVQQQMRAFGAAFVTTSRYTTDARAFASSVGMWLIDGEELLGIIRAGLDGNPLAVPAPTATAEPTCPACGGAMVRRTARRGPSPGT